MGKNNKNKSSGKKKENPDKKAALQAKKEAKADKAALKRWRKEEETAESSSAHANAHRAEELCENNNGNNGNRIETAAAAVGTVVVEELKHCPPPRANATLTLYEDSIQKQKRKEMYLFGGEYHDGLSSTVFNQMFRLIVSTSSSLCRWAHIHYKATSHTTHTKHSFPPPRCAHSTVYYNHALYVFGGEISAGDDSDSTYYHYRDCWRFDLKSYAWTEIRPSSSSSNTKLNQSPTNTHKAAGAGGVPSPRSGHSAVVWKHYMIVFGGFFEAASSAPHATAKWFNNVCVLDLHTHVWLDWGLGSSSMMHHPHHRSSSSSSVVRPLPTSQPDPRSAANVCVLSDHLIVHGGFSKLNRRKDVSSSSSSSATTTITPRSSSNSNSSRVVVAETKVHTDAWKLPLKPLIEQGKLLWERLTWSLSSASSSPPPRDHHHPNPNPSGRSGCSAIRYKEDQLLVFGGVVDAQHFHHQIKSVFYNDLCVFHVPTQKWYPFPVHNNVHNNVVGSADAQAVHTTSSSSSTQRQRRPQPQRQKKTRQEKPPWSTTVESDREEDWSRRIGSSSYATREDGKHKEEDDDDDTADELDDDDNTDDKNTDDSGDFDRVNDDDDDDDDDEEEEEERTVEDHNIGWDLSRLRLNMRSFLDGDGNVIYENVDIGGGGGGENDNNNNNIERVTRTEEKENEETKEKEETKMTQSSCSGADNTTIPQVPLPRINARLVITSHHLYVYGGLVEVGDREVTLDDLWRVDLRSKQKQKQKRAWECLFRGTMHQQVWRGAMMMHDDEDEDDSYLSGGTTPTDTTVVGDGPDDDDEEEEEDDDAASENDDFDLANHGPCRAAPTDMRCGAYSFSDNISTMTRDHHHNIIDPYASESLVEYYSRTSAYWIEQVVSGTGTGTNSTSSSSSSSAVVVVVDKNVRREAFQRARQHVSDHRDRDRERTKQQKCPAPPPRR